MDILFQLRNLVLEQKRLLGSLTSRYPSILADRLLFSLPNSGEISVDGEKWEYRKHGLGICFKNVVSTKEIDVVRHIENPLIFDQWRLEIYLESCGCKYSASEIEKKLQELEELGVIVRSDVEVDYFMFVDNS